jgi:hypothetical protein
MTTLNKPVEDLRAEDFELLSDGQPQTARMTLRDSTPLPIYAVIVVQVAEQIEPALAKVKKTASVVSSYIGNNMDIGIPSLAAGAPRIFTSMHGPATGQIQTRQTASRTPLKLPYSRQKARYYRVFSSSIPPLPYHCYVQCPATKKCKLLITSQKNLKSLS